MDSSTGAVPKELSNQARAASDQWSVRSLLLFLVLACLLPGIIAATGFFIYEYRQSRAELARSTVQTARALVQAIDSEIHGVQRLGQGLAIADTIAAGDLVGFHRQARRALAGAGLSGSTVALSDESGQLVLNTGVEFGTPLPLNGNVELVRRVFGTGGPVVSDLFTGAVFGRPLMAVGVPVFVEGKVVFALTVSLQPEQFNNILSAQGLPDGWVATVFDRAGTIVARSRAFEQYVGGKPADDYFQELMKSGEGTFEAVMKDGVPVLAASTRSPVTGWRVAVNIPREALNSQLVHYLSALALAVAALFAIGMALAWNMGGRIVRSFQALVAPATALGVGKAVPLPLVEVKEASDVTRALGEAAKLLRERTAALEAREKELAERSAALRQSEIRLRTLTEHAPAAIAVFDRDMRYLAASRRWLKDHRLEEKEVIGACHYEVLPDLPVIWRDAHRRGLAGEVLRAEADRLERADGAVQWMRWEVWPWRDDTGAVAGIIIAVEEITERVNAEEQLRESEERFRLLADNIPQLAWMADENGRIFWFNRRWLDYTGTTNEHMEGWSWEAVIHPDHAERAVSKICHCFEAGEPWEETFPLKGADGQYRWFLSRAIPQRDASGRVLRWFGTNTDVTKQRETEQALYRFKFFNDNASEGHFVMDRDARFVYVNKVACESLGYSESELLELGVPDIDPNFHDLKDDGIFEYGSHQRLPAFETLHRRKDGSIFPVEISAALLDLEGERLMFATSRDISERKRAEAALTQSEERFRAMAESLPEIIFVADASGGINYVNSRWSEQTGLSREAAFGTSWIAAIHPEDRDDAVQAWQAAVACGGEFKHEHRLRWAKGGYRWCQARALPIKDDEGRIVQWFGACSDIHDVKLSQTQLQHAALHDPLTGLPNRALFHARLRDALQRAARHRDGVATMFVDLDHFKPINDSLGHEAGDLALQTIAQRLQALVRKTDTVARLGGDEFAVLLEELKEADEAARVAQAVLDAVRKPIPIAGREVVMSASVGISCYPQDGENPSTLLNNADAAMYRAKQESRAAFRFFAPEMNAQAEHKFFLANSLRRVVERDELLLHYQPRVCLFSGKVLGAEALVRWQSPEHGLIPPGRFIELAEEIGVIEPIGEWVLRHACEQYIAWKKQGVAPEFISVNLSPRQFGQAHITGRIEEILTETGMSAQALELELTENVVMQDPAKALRTLAGLHGLGIRLSLDDFGTGCSGLAYLKRFPISHLKIDRSFVSDVPGDPEDVAIIRAIIALANSLKLGLTAEGVETEAQRAFLVEEGCQVAQGFLFSTPVPPERLMLCQGGRVS